jgi:hypothetical protein
LLEVQAKNGPKFVTILISVSSIGRLPEAGKRLCVPLSPSKANRDESTSGWAGHRNRARAWRIDRHGARRNFGELPHLAAVRPEQIKARAKTVLEGSACVLIADDEGPVRRAAAQILLRKGYNAIEASDVD